MDEIAFLFENEDQYLFHYTKIETAILYILPQMRLRFSSLPMLNDPRERNIKHFECIWKEMDEIWRTVPIIEEFLNKHGRVLCFTEHRKMERKIDPKGMEHINPYSRGFALPAMWAHYGDNHRGVCLVFDKKMLLQQVDILNKNNFHFSSMNYNSDTSFTKFDNQEFDKNEPEYLSKFFFQENLNALWFTKMPNWSYEQEFRIVNFSGTDYLPIGNSLTTIITSQDTPIELIARMREQLEKQSCQAIHSLVFRNGDYTPMLELRDTV